MKKTSNAIVIGGPIAVGKSTLVGSLPFVPIQELDNNDELQAILLKKMYEGDALAPQLFQLDIMLTRFDKYKAKANAKEIHAFDRSIFEDYLFAEKLFADDVVSWNYYEGIWKDKVQEIMKNIGVPRVYILLTCTWETFKERVFARGRKEEIDNFEKNRDYFRLLIQEYENYMKQIFEKYEIEHFILNTDSLSKIDVIETVKKELKARGIK